MNNSFWKFQPSSALRQRNLKTQVYFYRLGLPSTLIRHENGVFRKRYSHWRNLKTCRRRPRGKRKIVRNSESLKWQRVNEWRPNPGNMVWVPNTEFKLVGSNCNWIGFCYNTIYCKFPQTVKFDHFICKSDGQLISPYNNKTGSNEAGDENKENRRVWNVVLMKRQLLSSVIKRCRTICKENLLVCWVWFWQGWRCVCLP